MYHRLPALRKKACFSGVHSTLPSFPYLQTPDWNAILVPRKPPRHFHLQKARVALIEAHASKPVPQAGVKEFSRAKEARGGSGE